MDDFSQYLIKDNNEDFSEYEVKDKRKVTPKVGAKAVHRGIASSVLSTPRAISGLLKHGSNALSEKGRDLAEREGREISPNEEKFTEYVTKVLGYPEELLEKIGLPTYQEASKFVQEKMGDQYTPEEEMSGLEKGLETGGSFFGSALTSPISAFGTVGRAATTGLAALGAGTASGLGGGPGSQAAAAIGVPAIFNMIKLIKTGKLSPTGKQSRELYEFGKSKGMTDAELTPILQSSGRKKILGGIAQPTERAANAIEASEGALGKIYSSIKEETSKMNLATPKQESKLLMRFDKILSDLEKSKMPPDSKKQAIEKIKDFMGNVVETGIGPEEIIETWQDINQSVDWRSFKTGKKILGSLKEPMSDLFKDLSPKHFKEFETANKMWGKLQDTARKVKPTEASKFIKYGEAGALVHGIIQLANTGSPKFLAAMATQRGVRLLATEMLTNPRLNNLLNKTIASAASGSKQSAIKAARDFEKGIRDFPEIYEEFDFSKMEN